MWFTKITGSYWINKIKYDIYIDEESEKAEYMFDGLLESLQYENVVFEIIKHEEYYKEKKQ